MSTLIEQYQSENRPRELEQFAKRIAEISGQRVSQLTSLSQLQSDEKANVDGFLGGLDDTSADQIKSENRTKLRGFARKQYRNEEVDALSLYLQRGSENQNTPIEDILEKLIDKVATDTSSDFATLIAAITTAHTS